MLVSRMTRAGAVQRLSAATLALTRMPTATHCLPKRILSMAASQHGLQSSDIQQGCRPQAPSSNPAVRMLPPLPSPPTLHAPNCKPSPPVIPAVWGTQPSCCPLLHPLPIASAAIRSRPGPAPWDRQQTACLPCVRSPPPLPLLPPKSPQKTYRWRRLIPGPRAARTPIFCTSPPRPSPH